MTTASLTCLRIGTWNVEYANGAEKNRLRAQRLQRADANVWVLTETHDRLDLGTEGYAAVSSAPTRDDGGRWVTIWSRFPVVAPVQTDDRDRTAAAIVASSVGPLLVYGTVLPWHSDRGRSGAARNWIEHHRVIREQGAEWARLRDHHAEAKLVVAGDLNTTVGCSAYYGTKFGRGLLAEALDRAALVCATREEVRPPGLVEHAFIDHVCLDRAFASTTRIVDAWDGVVGGVKLSDHSGVVVEINGGGSTAPLGTSSSAASRPSDHHEG